MEYISVGKIMEPYALKGEVKIASDFKFKADVFKVNNKLYLGDAKQELSISKARFYKDRYYVLFDEYNHINDVTGFIKQIVYVKKEELNLDQNNYLNEDIIGFDVYDKNKKVGVLEEVRTLPNNTSIFGIRTETNKLCFIPNNLEFVKQIDFMNKKIMTILIKGMIE